MAKTLDKLTPLKVERLKAPGLYSDGGGLYLQISANGGRSWIFRYRMGGRKTPRDMGLGSLNDVSLAVARLDAAAKRRQIQQGVDPIEARKRDKVVAALDVTKAITFKDCAEAYIAAHREGWRNEKHAAQWTATLEAYAYPKLGKLPVRDVDVGHVLKVLEQKCDDLKSKPTLWSGKTQTASRVRGRIEAILDWAKVRKYRDGENPARWRGNLEHSLPARTKVQKVIHYPALPYAEIGSFITKLRIQRNTAAIALELLILTGTRTSEVLGARWDEIDEDKALWVIPANRIKAGKEHRIPLSAPALAIIKQLAKSKESEFVFRGKKGKTLTINVMMDVLKRMERNDITVHGFRSTFRDWAAESTNYPRDVAEMALAHTIGDKVEAAYRRGDLMEKRRRMMDDWAKFCGTVTKAGNVVAINKKGR
ncbi:MAG: site-specific integrase [Alphaproteobacteria bacterium]|nr:site-specific integrase [Alphaproteobacteria bacterium]